MPSNIAPIMDNILSFILLHSIKYYQSDIPISNTIFKIDGIEYLRAFLFILSRTYETLSQLFKD